MCIQIVSNFKEKRQEGVGPPFIRDARVPSDLPCARKGLAVPAAVGPVVVVELLPLLQPPIELFDRGDDHPLQLPVELLIIDPIGSLAFPVEIGAPGPNAMLDAFVERASGTETRTHCRCRSGCTGR